MIVHRFMSNAEYARLLEGKELYNNTGHKKNGKRTSSVGFCFFTEDPEDAVHWLSGIVNLEQCVTMEIPDGFLIPSFGMYLDEDGTDLSRPMNYQELMSIAKFKKRTEYCRCRYSLKDVKVISATDKYYSKYPPIEYQQELIKAMLAGARI